MIQRCVVQKCIDHVHYYALVLLEFTDCRGRDNGFALSRFRTS